MANPITRTLYILAVAVLAAALTDPETGSGNNSIVWLVIWFVLAALFFFALVLFDISGQRTGRPPSKPFHSYQHALLSPNGLRWLGYGFFAAGLGSAMRAALDSVPSEPEMYTHLAYGTGALVGLLTGEWIVYRGEAS